MREKTRRVRSRSRSRSRSASERGGRGPKPSAGPSSVSASTTAPSASPRRASHAGSASPGTRAASSPQGGGSDRRAASASPSKSRSPERQSPPRKPPVRYAHRRTSGEVWRCKKGKRTDIKPDEWDRFGYAAKEEVLTRPIEYDDQTVPIRRVKRKDITPEWFYENIASKNLPAIIEDACGMWPAMQRWSIEALEERFKNVPFKVAKDDKGKKLRMKFKYYADYIRRQQDDSPLYLFETNVDDNGYIRPLVNDYEQPEYFPHDWLALVNNDARPPYRWFCIGPKRSGTTVHIDPLGTSAWNAVTHGRKRWVLFEPKENKRVVKGRDVIRKGEDDEAVMYFDFILPRIKKAHPELKVYEGIQGPGDIIFVPGDWWHGVLNLDDTVAVTQNYCGPDNFRLVWKRTRKEREKVAYLWLRNMKRYAPELYERALRLNRRDGFRMRHEREPGEKLSSCSSSSSESSSDSSSDEAVDLDPTGLQKVLRRGLVLGAAAFRHQGEPPPGLALAPRASTIASTQVSPSQGGEGAARKRHRRREGGREEPTGGQ
uniref:JmjC domain-containing protein n=2 Tax=Alexandrium monilatum TaxID=311494 RepID=A0A7S4VSV2_9DINO